MQLTLNLKKLLLAAAMHFGQACEVQTLHLTPLANGIHQCDMTFWLANEQRLAPLAFVHKTTYRRREIYALQALSALTTTPALPGLVDAAIDPAAPDDAVNDQPAHWFVTPFYPGATLTFDDEPPLAIIEALAQVHVHFASRVAELRYLERVDGAFFRRICDNALTILAKAQQEKPHPIYEEAFHCVSTTRDNPHLYTALARLPVTLTHGDVHPGNMLVTPDGQAMLIDWGNVCLAPAMLDLANMVTLGSPSWLHYLAAWEKASGAPLDRQLAELGFNWATVMINVFYLPYAVDFLPAVNVQGMVGRLWQAEQRLTQSPLNSIF